LPQVAADLHDARSVVVYFKGRFSEWKRIETFAASLANPLPLTALVLQAVTRWMTGAHMLRSYSIDIPAIRAFSAIPQNNCSLGPELLPEIEVDGRIAVYYSLLEELEHLTQFIQGDTYCTLAAAPSMVLHTLNKLEVCLVGVGGGGGMQVHQLIVCCCRKRWRCFPMISGRSASHWWTAFALASVMSTTSRVWPCRQLPCTHSLLHSHHLTTTRACCSAPSSTSFH